MGISFRGLGQVASRERLRMILSLVNFMDLRGAQVVKVYSGVHRNRTVFGQVSTLALDC